MQETAGNTPNRDVMLQIMMAEQATLAGARSSTIFDANGRVNLYMGSLSSALVAIGFIGQASDMDQSFFIFVLLLFLPLLFIGLTTYDRVLQISIADMVYSRGMNRIRHFYTEVAPETARYFILPTEDDMASMLREMGTEPSMVQIFLSTPGLVSGLNSLVLGVFAAILMHVIVNLTLLTAVVVGSVTFMIGMIMHTRHQQRRWAAREKQLVVLFPSSDTSSA